MEQTQLPVNNCPMLKEGLCKLSLTKENPDFQLIKKISELHTENERLKEENRWIPVSERLPEKTGEYLVLPYHQHCPTLWYQDNWYWYDQQDDAISDTMGHNASEPIFEVTHWKPIILPEQALNKEAE